MHKLSFRALPAGGTTEFSMFARVQPEFEYGVLLPERRTQKRDYPHGRMEVGQSFLSQRGYASEGALAYRMGKLHGMKFAVRKVDGGVRVWRTA